MAQTINVRCPGCGLVLAVTNSKNEAEKRFSCPGCGKPIMVPFYKLHDGGGETQLASSPHRDTKHTLWYNGVSYLLHVGQNIVGRKATTSTADVQIDTQDRYMSREHALLKVYRLSDGTIKVDISNHKNKNVTSINGLQLHSDDILVLHDGDRIKLGDTTLVYRVVSDLRD